MHGKNGTWIIHGDAGKITVYSSTFYGVNSNFYFVKNYGMFPYNLRCNFCCRRSKNHCLHLKMIMAVGRKVFYGGKTVIRFFYFLIYFLVL